MVFFAAPVTRTVARIDMPSTRQPTIRARCSVLNRLLILTIMRERSGIVKVYRCKYRGHNACILDDVRP